MTMTLIQTLKWKLVTSMLHPKHYANYGSSKQKNPSILEKQKRLQNIRKELTRVSGLVTEEDDWFYGSELRLQGVALKQEGAELDETRRQLQADANSKSREIRDELENFQEEKNRQMEEEIAQIQEKMNQQRQAAMEKAEERVQEITRNKTRKAALFEKEEKLAPPEDRAKLAAQHKNSIEKLDEAVAAERAKQSEILSKAEQAGEKDLGDKNKRNGIKLCGIDVMLLNEKFNN